MCLDTASVVVLCKTVGPNAHMRANHIAIDREGDWSRILFAPPRALRAREMLSVSDAKVCCVCFMSHGDCVFFFIFVEEWRYLSNGLELQLLPCLHSESSIIRIPNLCDPFYELIEDSLYAFALGAATLKQSGSSAHFTEKAEDRSRTTKCYGFSDLYQSHRSGLVTANASRSLKSRFDA